MEPQTFPDSSSSSANQDIGRDSFARETRQPCISHHAPLSSVEPQADTKSRYMYAIAEPSQHTISRKRSLNESGCEDSLTTHTRRRIQHSAPVWHTTATEASTIKDCSSDEGVTGGPNRKHEESTPALEDNALGDPTFEQGLETPVRYSASSYFRGVVAESNDDSVQSAASGSDEFDSQEDVSDLEDDRPRPSEVVDVYYPSIDDQNPRLSIPQYGMDAHGSNVIGSLEDHEMYRIALHPLPMMAPIYDTSDLAQHAFPLKIEIISQEPHHHPPPEVTSVVLRSQVEFRQHQFILAPKHRLNYVDRRETTLELPPMIWTPFECINGDKGFFAEHMAPIPMAMFPYPGSTIHMRAYVTVKNGNKLLSYIATAAATTGPIQVLGIFPPVQYN
ncbi:hypothetical protein SERLA73DRAFT_78545 [Serpula lacrymans var. lacrymans S7.3]|uniref:Uncharacterized protein n=2 Tax=Serpula lacrymans var. lacrymans TaxID=341189 RepID=F8QDK7_SERL3|nr:uncharacterized protein SERLADRAFT_443589 [Serpula lacrymans var. lacrymans S7.9]EGN93678.1 hypothetical protein SERLA73DRAFT_78545 [Serpula lacrymans var. lacrymans S7.3]EGO19052.1 hypothetical protein SERLADRAFT_443589 [Serpula lacrymans var. lacrymans S7.9]